MKTISAIRHIFPALILLGFISACTSDQTTSIPDSDEASSGLASQAEVGEIQQDVNANETSLTERDTVSANDTLPASDTAESRGQLAGLSTEQVQQLMNMNLKSPNLGLQGQAVIIPSFVPSGFEIHDLTVSSHSEDDESFYIYYSILYKNEKGACFLIQQYGFDGPIGEGNIDVDEIENIEIPALDIAVNLGYSNFSRESSPDLIIMSLDGSEGYGSSYDFFTPVINDACETGLDLRESTQIIQSLQYLDPKETRKLQFTNGLLLPNQF